jgi:hypothetical protein
MPVPILPTYAEGLVAIESEVMAYLVTRIRDVRGGHVDLVDDRKDLQVVLEGHVHVGKGLGLHTLGCIHQKDGAFAGTDGPGHLVGEIHVAGGVDKIEGVFTPVLGG